jgi:hypothetical protein
MSLANNKIMAAWLLPNMARDILLTQDWFSLESFPPEYPEHIVY